MMKGISLTAAVLQCSIVISNAMLPSAKTNAKIQDSERTQLIDDSMQSSCANDDHTEDEVIQMDSMTSVLEHCNAIGYSEPGSSMQSSSIADTDHVALEMTLLKSRPDDGTGIGFPDLHFEENDSSDVEDSDAAFLPSKKFRGPKEGYSFKLDQLGIGYYQDTPPEVVYENKLAGYGVPMCRICGDNHQMECITKESVNSPASKKCRNCKESFVILPPEGINQQPNNNVLLPTGWFQTNDPNTGRRVYVNPKKRRSQYNVPTNREHLDGFKGAQVRITAGDHADEQALIEKVASNGSNCYVELLFNNTDDDQRRRRQFGRKLIRIDISDLEFHNMPIGYYECASCRQQEKEAVLCQTCGDSQCAAAKLNLRRNDSNLIEPPVISQRAFLEVCLLVRKHRENRVHHHSTLHRLSKHQLRYIAEFLRDPTKEEIFERFTGPLFIKRPRDRQVAKKGLTALRCNTFLGGLCCFPVAGGLVSAAICMFIYIDDKGIAVLFGIYVLIFSLPILIVSIVQLVIGVTGYRSRLIDENLLSLDQRYFRGRRSSNNNVEIREINDVVEENIQINDVVEENIVRLKALCFRD